MTPEIIPRDGGAAGDCCFLCRLSHPADALFLLIATTNLPDAETCICRQCIEDLGSACLAWSMEQAIERIARRERTRF